MAQFASSRDYSVTEHQAEPIATSIANPIPLGLGALAFTTAILGCVYAGFIVHTSIAIVIGFALFYGGIVQLLAGMWEFRKSNTVAATVFASYGGFLLALGITFAPGLGIVGTLQNPSTAHAVLGLFFLCWTIFTGVLFLGSLRTSLAFLIVLALLFLSYLLLTIGELAGGSTVLLIIGGWLGIVCALVAWYTALASILRSVDGAFRLPVGLINSPTVA
ncbi:MAG TPA: acetate uptake transporter [Ktedonosporobacter sp.]|jgi:succinate-acetate transporter protein|nr:acetate uptake transporter [Ktedonosporobacter sp.]